MNTAVLKRMPTTHDIPSLLSDHNRNSFDISQLQSHRQSFMADSEHSSSDDCNTDSGDVCKEEEEEEEESREESKLEFSEDEEMLIIRMYNLIGERWSLIAGRIPGRTAEQIEKYWNSRYSTSE